jgi:hypothetical protein
MKSTSNPTKLQEFATEFFRNMTLSELMTNNPYVTTKGYAEVGDCENNAESFTEVSWAWEAAFEARIKAHASEKAAWIVLQKEVLRQTRTTIILANDEDLLKLLLADEWQMRGYYANFTAWSDENAKDVLKKQIITASFYAHELDPEHLHWLAANHQIDLQELAAIEAE